MYLGSNSLENIKLFLKTVNKQGVILAYFLLHLICDLFTMKCYAGSSTRLVSELVQVQVNGCYAQLLK